MGKLAQKRVGFSDARIIDFYSRIPGAKMVVHRPCRYTRFSIGHTQLHLLPLTGRMPFRMEVETDDLEIMYEELCKAGIEPESRPKVRP